MSKEVKKEDSISEAINKNPLAGEILFNEGLFCVGCGMAQFETIEQGCELHGIDINKILNKINGKIKNKSIKKDPKKKISIKKKTIKKTSKKN